MRAAVPEPITESDLESMMIRWHLADDYLIQGPKSENQASSRSTL